MRFRLTGVSLACLLIVGFLPARAGDFVRDLQGEGMSAGHAAWGHWGPDPSKYAGWGQHSNRLIPVYTFGVSLDDYRGAHSPYRDAKRIEQLYGRLPEGTLNPQAEYFDQTDIYRLQEAAVDAGKKRIILFVFDGMDWQTTWAAAIYYKQQVAYREGRGTGLYFLDYRGAPTDYGYFVSSPHNEGTSMDASTQTIKNPGGRIQGGFDAALAGPNPWTPGSDPLYIIAQSKGRRDAFTDSSSSATSLCSGIKTFNDGVNIDFNAVQVEPIARKLQARGWGVGVVTSVPVSHATPSSAYANNVQRDDYQDLSRDLIGLPSVSHPDTPLSGVDVLLGCGWGEVKEKDSAQGDNFVPGNVYLTEADLRAVDVEHGGAYRVVQRASGVNGRESVAKAAQQAADAGERLLGFYGSRNGHLPFRTADGGYDPLPGVRRYVEKYSDADRTENPTLADLAVAALTVLSRDPEGFWLMVESGDVDWANHDNNIDASIGAVKSGDDAFRAVVEWIEGHGGWDNTALILTADHGHYLVLEQPEVLAGPPGGAAQ